MTRHSLAFVLSLAATLWSGSAQAFDTSARAALVVDHATGLVLLEKDAHVPLPPASMSKLMTLYMLFEAIRDGRVTPETEFVVSNRAQAMGGSRMFVEAGTTVTVLDLIRGIIVQSGNDACVVVAEGLAGSEAAFAERMTERARQLGLNDSVLKNSSGWPEEGHLMSAWDLVQLSRMLIDEFPEYYTMFDEVEFTYNGITQQNRNPLLTLGIGADGLKTGHTQEAGYGLVGSAVQDGQRIVFMVTGLEGMQERRIETEQLVRWAFSAFQPVQLYRSGETIGQAEVWMGERATVPIVAPRDLQMLIEAGTRETLSAEIVYTGPVAAPVAQGQTIARLAVRQPGKETAHFDLAAGADVPEGGLMTRVEAAAMLVRDRALAALPIGN
jgi:serine-type D-Ala-D-Ala carboxypeptidase (penicillin-binding protein 5/6)